MPRQIDMQCPKCGFVEETLKEVIFFEDEESMKDVCPECDYPYRTSLPPRINIRVQAAKDPSPRPQKPHRLSTGMLPEEVREVFAEELFDPCSCGDHAPADLFQHKEDCHVQQHSFMKEKSVQKETD